MRIILHRIKAEMLETISRHTETKRSVVSWMRVARCDIVSNYKINAPYLTN